LITQTASWRHIGIIGEATAGIVLMGYACDSERHSYSAFLCETTIQLSVAS
jgi:hypothetical protein